MLDGQGRVAQRRFQRNYRVRESGSGILEQALGIASQDAASPVELAQDHVRVRVHVDSPTYWRYQRLNAIVELDITPGWHVYAAPTPEGYAALSVEVSGDALEAGHPVWPPSAPFLIAGLGEQFRTYDGTARVAVPFEFIIQRGEEMGDRTITVRVRYQACDATTCNTPQEASFELMVGERPAVE